MKKTGILYIIDTFFGLAGAERNIFETAGRINREKFRPWVFILAPGARMDILEKENIPVRNLGIKRVYGVKGLIEGFRLMEFIRREDIKKEIDISKEVIIIMFLIDLEILLQLYY